MESSTFRFHVENFGGVNETPGTHSQYFPSPTHHVASILHDLATYFQKMTGNIESEVASAKVDGMSTSTYSGFYTSRNFPTYHWNIPQTPNQQFMKEFLSFGGLGMPAACCRVGSLRVYPCIFVNGCPKPYTK